MTRALFSSPALKPNQTIPVSRVNLAVGLQGAVSINRFMAQFNSPGSGGGAHSDIYRLPMGRLLWRLVEEYALQP
jgi:hypothetical protein